MMELSTEYFLKLTSADFRTYYEAQIPSSPVDALELREGSNEEEDEEQHSPLQQQDQHTTHLDQDSPNHHQDNESSHQDQDSPHFHQDQTEDQQQVKPEDNSESEATTSSLRHEETWPWGLRGVLGCAAREILI